MHDDNDCSGKDTSRPQASNGTTYNQGRRVWRGTAESRSDLKDSDGSQKDKFGVVEGVDSAEEKLERTAGKHVGTSVPADITQGVEIVGDLGNGGGKDSTILVNGQYNCTGQCSETGLVDLPKRQGTRPSRGLS